MNSSEKAFILTAKSIDIGGKLNLQLHCVNDSGPLLVNIDDQKALFFVERNINTKNIPYKFEKKELKLKSMSSKDIDGLYFNSQSDFFKAREYCKENGIRTYESDVKTIDRFLMERFINGSIEISGEFKVTNNLKVYSNPQIKKTKFTPRLSLLSLDIETSMKNDLYSIAFHLRSDKTEIKKVLMINSDESNAKTSLEYLTFVRSEKELLLKMVDLINRLDPDIIVGWHIIGFDFDFLLRKGVQHGVELKIGRNLTNLTIREKKGSGWFSNIDGRVILDGPPVLRGAFLQFENYKLDTVASVVLNEKKEINQTGIEKVEEISRRFHHDKEALATYNLLDCTLVLDIFKKLNLIEMLLTRVEISGLLLDRVGASTAAFDHFYLPHFHRKGFVTSNIIDISRVSQSGGGLVIDPVVGLHEHVIVMDFKSLYPSIIRTFKIDPLSNIKSDISPIRTPMGLKFSRTEHILPNFIGDLLQKRQVAKDKNDKNLSYAIKILMNSFYGVMGSGGSRFYNANLPDAITKSGQWILKECISYLEEEGYKVLYGDTDSIFIKLTDNDKINPFKTGDRFVIKLNQYFTKLIKKQFHIESHLEIEFEKYYKSFFLPISRTGQSGAKKRYAGLICDRAGKTSLDFKGLEVVRSDWTQMAKDFQSQLFQKLFLGDDIENLIKETTQNLKDGLLDDKISYKKRLTKPAFEYTKNIPPHVRAALILDPDGQKKIRNIEYIITENGPEPIQLIKGKIDYLHYIEKQLKPIANGVLFIFDKSFDDLIIGDQLSLF